ncbi:glycosyltransferase family 2 protein [Bizionia sediminis]|uniref:Glycosyltransferase family 2 protein n=1 Tax=Bizionia sediminis TaxID=1737064 RepID=A0ABW5KRI3_9FLAO
MPFHLLKYLQPTHYFALKKRDGAFVFPVVDQLPSAITNQLEPDTSFKSALSQTYDLSWQAIQKGYIGDAATYQHFEALPLADNYRFIRKYFHLAWVVYVLLFRFASLKNPFKEWRAFYGSRHTASSCYLETPLVHTAYAGFESDLLARQPKVSVIIPTLNRYVFLKDVLKDLEAQDYTNFEVLVVDQSEPFQQAFYEGYNLDIQVIRQDQKALWLARNTAVKKAAGDYLLFFDDDSRVDAKWISAHIKCLDYFNADLSSGVSISKVGAEIPANYSFFRVSDQLDTGNVLIKKTVFYKIGLFDRQFERQRMGDGEYGLRSYLQGFLNVSNPQAKRLHLKVDSGGLREMGSWDAFRTKKWFAPRPLPSVLYFFRKYFGDKFAILAVIRTVPFSIIPYKYKKNKGMMLLGVFISILLLPLVFIQVIKSWRLASTKLIEGAKIDSLV